MGSSFDVEQLLIVATTARKTITAIMGMRKAYGQKSADGDVMKFEGRGSDASSGYPLAGALR
jgi:hypothetical protein